MPVVRISDVYFANLKAISIWIGTRSPSETLERLILDAVNQIGIVPEDNSHLGEALDDGRLRFESAPDLTFTRVRKAFVASQELTMPNWQKILIATIKMAMSKTKQGASDMTRRLGIPAQPGVQTKHGYRYHPSIGMSVQGQSAADAWKETERLAREFGITLAVEFQWEKKDRALHPGKVGLITLGTSDLGS